MNKIALAQSLLRTLSEKKAGIAVPAGVAAGLGVLTVGRTLGKGTKKAVEYHKGFRPNYIPEGH